MRVPQGSTDVSDEVGFGIGCQESEVRGPYHWCRVRAYAPFVVVAHSGVVRGGLDAHGGTSVFFWFFGHTRKIRELVLWDV